MRCASPLLLVPSVVAAGCFDFSHDTCRWCDAGRSCKSDADCASQHCSGGVCVLDPAPCAPTGAAPIATGPPFWRPIPTMPHDQMNSCIPGKDLYGVSAFGGADGRIYAVEGCLDYQCSVTNDALDCTWIYDPAAGGGGTGTWSPGPQRDATIGYVGYTASAEVALPTPSIAVVGGRGANAGVQGATTLLDEASRAGWLTTPHMTTARAAFGLAATGDGTLVATGGWDGGAGLISSTELRSSTAWTFGPSLLTPRMFHAAASDASGRVYAIGGASYKDSTAPYRSVEVLASPDGTWQYVHEMSTARQELGAVRGSDGRIYAVGGNDGSVDLATVEAYDPTTDTWATVSPLSATRRGHATVVAGDGRIYALSGIVDTQAQATGTGEAYGPVISLAVDAGSATISGENFAADANVCVYLQSGTLGPWLLAIAQSDSAGGLADVVVRVPDVANGGISVRAIDAASRYPAFAPQ